MDLHRWCNRPAMSLSLCWSGRWCCKTEVGRSCCVCLFWNSIEEFRRGSSRSTSLFFFGKDLGQCLNLTRLVCCVWARETQKLVRGSVICDFQVDRKTVCMQISEELMEELMSTVNHVIFGQTWKYSRYPLKIKIHVAPQHDASGGRGTATPVCDCECVYLLHVSLFVWLYTGSSWTRAIFSVSGSGCTRHMGMGLHLSSVSGRTPLIWVW